MSPCPGTQRIICACQVCVCIDACVNTDVRVRGSFTTGLWGSAGVASAMARAGQTKVAIKELNSAMEVNAGTLAPSTAALGACVCAVYA